MEKKRVNVNIDHGEHAFFTDNVSVMHNPKKFVIDFSQTVPKFDNIGGKTQQSFSIKHRTIILDPQFAKIFLNVLKQNIKKYEKKFGEIKLPKKRKVEKKKIMEADEARYSRYIG